jgi:hypothetical protein
MAERHAPCIAVEQRRKHLPRQRRGEEQRVARERGDDLLAGLACFRAVLGQLLVALRPRRLVAGRDVAVDPGGRVDAVANPRDGFGVEHFGDRQQHRVTGSCSGT